MLAMRPDVCTWRDGLAISAVWSSAARCRQLPCPRAGRSVPTAGRLHARVASVSPGGRVPLLSQPIVPVATMLLSSLSFRILTVHVTSCMLGDQHWMRRPCCAGSRIGMRGNGPASRTVCILLAVWLAASRHVCTLHVYLSLPNRKHVYYVSESQNSW